MTKTPLQYAEEYHALGLSVFLLPPRKKFTAKGVGWKRWQTERADLEMIRHWWGFRKDANIAAATGQISGFIVIDVDQDPGKEGAETLHDLQRAYDDLPDTWEAHTGGGGRHLFFAPPPGVIIPNKQSFYGLDLDVRGDGGLVVMPGSIHPNGRPYEWKAGHSPEEWGGPPEAMPDWLVELLKVDADQLEVHETARKMTGDLDGLGTNGEITVDVWGAVIDGRKLYMRNLVFSTFVNALARDGHVMEPQELFDAVWPCYVRNVKARGKTLEEEGAGQTLLMEKCTYQAKPSRLAQAEKRADGQREREAQKERDRLAAELTAPVPARLPTPTPTIQTPAVYERTSEPLIFAPAVLSFNDAFKPGEASLEIIKAVNNGHLFDDHLTIVTPMTLGLEEPPAQQWLVKDWIPQGVTTGIYGPGGSGKSYIIQQLGYALASRTSWCGLEVSPDGPPLRSLMIMGEDELDEIKRRHHRIVFGLKLENDLDALHNCEMVPMAGKDLTLGRFDSNGKMETTDFYQALLERVRFGNYDFLSLDTVSDVFSGNENDRSVVNHFVKVCLGGLREARKAATGKTLNIMIIGHPPKGGAGYSGSTAWNAAVRARLEFNPDGEVDEMRRLILAKSNYSPPNEGGLPLVMDHGVFMPINKPDSANTAALVGDIRAIVAKARADKYPLQDRRDEEKGLVAVVLRSLEKRPKSHVLAVLRKMISDAKDGCGPLVFQKNSTKETSAGYSAREDWGQ